MIGRSSWEGETGWRSVLSAGLLLALSCGMAGSMTGCGTPAAPQPPSLKLPAPVSDLTAVRAGDTVTLRWTTTRRTTDRLLIKGPVHVQVCRRRAADGCEPAGEVDAQPGAAGEFQDRLPAELQAGAPRVLHYFVELRNAHGRSAGTSNAAVILAGAAPGAVRGMAAEVRANGVALRWQADERTAVRLHRTLLTPAAKKPAGANPNKTRGKDGAKAGGKSPLPAPVEPVERSLWVEAPAAGAPQGSLDASAHFGESYAYTAQQVARVEVDGQTLELSGPASEPVRVEVIDRFPPAVPSGLVAVAAPEDKSIDLSWTPDTDADLAGYIVYRAKGEGADSWQRISGSEPVAEAAWRDTTAAPGESYRYRVTAIDQTGHESAPSGEAQEKLPNP